MVASPHFEFMERLELAKDQVRVGGALHPYLLETEQRLQVCRLPLWRFGAWAAALPWRLPEKFPRVAPLAVMAPEPDARSGATWPLTKPKRDDGLATPIFRVLKAAHDAEAPRPNAREVLEAFRTTKPTEVVRVLADGCDFFDRKGNEASAGVDSIRKRIDHMTAAQAPRKTRKRPAARAAKTSRRV